MLAARNRWLDWLCRFGIHDWRWWPGFYAAKNYRACYRCGIDHPDEGGDE